MILIILFYIITISTIISWTFSRYFKRVIFYIQIKIKDLFESKLELKKRKDIILKNLQDIDPI